MALVRLIVFALIVIVVHLGALRLAARMGIAIDPVSYGAGLAVGVVVGFVWFMINNWLTAATRPFHPQTVTLQTKETPFQVTAAAGGGCVFFIIAVVVLLLIAFQLLGIDIDILH